MKTRTRYFSLSALLAFFLSVRVRLTLWYLGTILIILFALGWSLHSSQAPFPSDDINSQVETQLDRDLSLVADAYKQTLLAGQAPAQAPLNLSDQEIVLLLRSDGSMLDSRGPLTANAIQQLQSKAQGSQVAFQLSLPATKSQNYKWGEDHRWWGGWDSTGEYQVFAVPILDQNTRIAVLMVGLPHEKWSPTPTFWFAHGALLVLISIVGGYILASKAMRPVRMITRMASQINATDLRQRLHLKRGDEFGELAATFDQMLARLEAAFKRQTQFTSDASHELRTPLTIIELEINRALTQLPSDAAYQQVLEQIQAENEHMTAIVNSLLLLARADTGRIDLKLEEVDLSDIALSCVERLLPLAQQNQLSLSTGALPELLVMGDPQYLTRMLMNLIENALKYTRGIGSRVHVELVSGQEHWGVIRVEDDGQGIAEQDLPYLFERFYRVDKARTYSQGQPGSLQEEPAGTGLGLSIVQWIVQAHGGEVRVESKLGAGSVFEVLLPLKQPAHD
jgi:signal transduction histidine kinase